MNLRAFVLSAAIASLAACAVAQQAPAGGFAKPPPEAVKVLKRTVGRPINAGMVFIAGKYIKPPYTVERHGTVIKINGMQATKEIIPWTEFIKTQEGVVATKTVSEVPGAGSADVPPPPEPEVEEEEDDFDADSSLDDLFDDDPKPKKKQPPKKKKSGTRPKPRKPTVSVSYTFDGEFVHNDKTRAYVEKINTARTAVDKRLRAGGCIFFGPKYLPCYIEMSLAKSFLSKIPEIMKNNPARAGFEQAIRSAGFTYLPNSAITELFRNRLDYPSLMERRKSMEEKNRWPGLIK